MTQTQKYDLVEIDYETTGWTGDLTTNMQILDDEIHSRFMATLGETVAEGDAIYQDTDAKWYQALADGTQQPAQGLAVEGGDLDDEIRAQRVGPFQKTGWRFKVPYKLWLDDTTPGALSHHKPAADDQLVGFAIAGDTIFLTLSNLEDVGPAFFGTTTTVSTTSSSTSSTTQTTTSSSQTTTSSSSSSTTTTT